MGKGVGGADQHCDQEEEGREVGGPGYWGPDLEDCKGGELTDAGLTSFCFLVQSRHW